MKIALDYDDTYTKDPIFWQEVLDVCNVHGHTMEIVTKRGVDNQGETIPKNIGMVINYTNRKPKLQAMVDAGKHFDIWIDDSPINLFVGG